MGFTRQRIKSKWLRYDHAETDTIIALIEKKRSDPVRITDAVSAQRHLVENGLVDEKELAAMFAEALPLEPVAKHKK